MHDVQMDSSVYLIGLPIYRGKCIVNFPFSLCTYLNGELFYMPFFEKSHFKNIETKASTGPILKLGT